jgi:hypothetical protein
MESKSRTARKTPHMEACELHQDKSELEIHELDGVVGGTSPIIVKRDLIPHKHLAGVKYED